MTHMLFHLFMKKEEKELKQQDQQKRSLNWFLFCWLGFIYAQYLSTRLWDLMDPEGATKASSAIASAKDPLPTSDIIHYSPLFVFTLLMALHVGLHWLALFKKSNPRYLGLYFPLQTLCIGLISVISGADLRGIVDNVVLGLCLTLVIEAIILLKRTSWIIMVVTGCLLFCLANQGMHLFAALQTAKPASDLSLAPKLVGGIMDSFTFIPFVCASFVLYIQQTTAHRRDQELLHELEMAHTQLEDYATQVKDLTLTTERQRMARELHDTLAQGLVGLTMQLETIDSLLIEQRYEQARTIVRQAMARSRATITSARAAITDLRTEPATAGDLLATIEAEAQHFTLATGIACTCCLQAELPGNSHEHLLRLVSEGLTNIARHAQASQAWIRSSVEHGTITFDIGDNGIGFDPARVATGHYGLLGLRERARLMNGHLLITSEPGRGTIVRLSLPWRENVCL
ncbi:sensor histidine kinase [Ktedonospora formicarum]|uniref:Sensor histidine kinase YdfH n=1 Tax=Ktedonospora formicarum TaxID=2778364 RepID=A0A8J3IAG7_9CHLR|nr:sensor histidine kinase [Ktedonospora formicarum]GHO49027.1 sensor histidine kinase YdfH [Ktedonospora formicarum]